ncbi:hypothetical protein Q7P37_002640 [Cladosporium fusiforme]
MLNNSREEPIDEPITQVGDGEVEFVHEADEGISLAFIETTSDALLRILAPTLGLGKKPSQHNMVVGDFPLDGKIVLVTGGGSGINLAFVKLALKSHAKVLIADLKLLKEAQDLLRDPDTAGRVAYTKCDVSKWSELARLPSEIATAFGQGAVADVWVPGAGVLEPSVSSFYEDGEDDHYKALRINTEHPIKLTRIAMRACLAANKPAVILLVASLAGVQGIYGSPLYAASKHAIVGFAKSMAQADKEENIKIVCVCPGIVSTPLWTGPEAKAVHEQYSYSDDMAISAGEVAEAMKDLVEQGRYEGGSLLEVSKRNGRKAIESLDAAGAAGPEAQAWLDGCYAPARQAFMRERGAGL